MCALWRRVWQLACVALVMAAAANAQETTGEVYQTNTTLATMAGWNKNINIELQDTNGKNISGLVAITKKAAFAARPEVRGNLAYTNTTTVSSLTSEDIAFISCNERDYPYPATTDNSPFAVLQQALDNHNFTAVILYSTAAKYCWLTTARVQEDSKLPIYSMTDMGDSAHLLADVNDNRPATKYFVVIRSTSLTSSKANDNGNGVTGQGDVSQQRGYKNDQGPSPSTAVAMIVLYSITGIITALFLVIIITGAVRAHRNPDRYGPRNILGVPRQSRARGLGRAILDTIPIVKFGEREQTANKPADIEMGSTAETRDIEDAADAGAGAQVGREGAESRTSDADAGRRFGDQRSGSGGAAAEEEQSGIAPAETTAAGALPRQSEPQEEGALSCSICTEDFEKGQDIRLLPCDHKFHPECVDPWLMNVSGTCPLCRVDLHPTSRTSSVSHPSAHDPHSALAPPLQNDADISHNRRSALRAILSFRSRPNASAEERILALRQFREARNESQRNIAYANAGAGASTGASASASASAEDVVATNARRSRRFSARLSGVFASRAHTHARRQQQGGQAGGGGAGAPSGPATPVVTSSGVLPAAREMTDDVAPAPNQTQPQTETQAAADNSSATTMDERPASPSRPAAAQ